MSVVLEVEKLIAPLGHDPYCIFHECADDEEASSCRYVSTASKSSSQRDVSSSTAGPCTLAIRSTSWLTFPKDNSLFYRVRRGIQPLLDLVCLLPELFQWTWVIRCVCSARAPKSIVLRTEIITRRAPYLSHGRWSCKWKLLLANVSVPSSQRRALPATSSWRRKESNECFGIYVYGCA